MYMGKSKSCPGWISSSHVAGSSMGTSTRSSGSATVPGQLGPPAGSIRLCWPGPGQNCAHVTGWGRSQGRVLGSLSGPQWENHVIIPRLVRWRRFSSSQILKIIMWFFFLIHKFSFRFKQILFISVSSCHTRPCALETFIFWLLVIFFFNHSRNLQV